MLARCPIHHLPDEFGAERLRFGATAVPILGDHRQGFAAGPRLVLLRHEPLDLVEENTHLLEVADEPWVAGDMDEREQQRGDADIL
jgi:hypothetical protein